MASVVRKPRAIVSLGGLQVLCEEVSVGQPKKAHAGTCSIKTSLTALVNAGADLDWLASQTEIDIEISFSVDGNDTPMFTGTADKSDINLTAEGQSVSISGRDKTSQMTDTKTREKFINQKSEDIASTVAGRHGLAIDTDGGTAMAGKIYTAEQARLTDGQSEWTLMRQLGEVEGKVPVVTADGKLSFKAIDDDSLPEYPIFYQAPIPGQPAKSNGVSIKLGRNYQAAKKITVKVNSWDHKKKQLITSEQSSGDGEPEQTYTYQHHHKTQEQADNHAKSKLKEHSRHEFDVTIEMPGDTSLTPFFQIALSGTNSAFDQDYNIDHIDHKMSMAGYRMTISTKAAKKGRNPK